MGDDLSNSSDQLTTSQDGSDHEEEQAEEATEGEEQPKEEHKGRMKGTTS
ncbi:MAG: hypothetical protein GY820_03805, partial [Gammaproteobacteria bacterium]|nr:hypothetical protein [Gammaproteobacteria bacterium]